MRIFSSFFDTVCFAPDAGGGGGGAASGADSGAGASSSSPASITPSEISSGGSAAGRDDGGGDDFAAFDLGDAGLDSVVLEPGSAASAVGESSGGGGAKEGAGAPSSATSPATASQKDAVAAAASAAPAAQTQSAPAAAQTSAQGAEGISSAEDVTIDNVAELLASEKDALVEKWAEMFFALSQEESEALATTPEQVLPKLAARILFQAVSAMSGQIKQFVPQMIGGHLQTSAKYGEAQEQFFASWPGLKGKDTNVISHAISAVKQAFPKLSRTEVISKAGEMSAIMLGLSADLARGGAKAPSAGTKSGENGSARVVAPPFRPSGAGSAHGTSAGNGHIAHGEDDPFAMFDLPNSGQ